MMEIQKIDEDRELLFLRLAVIQPYKTAVLCRSQSFIYSCDAGELSFLGNMIKL